MLKKSSLAGVFCAAALLCATADQVARAQQVQTSPPEQPTTDAPAATAAPAPDKSGYTFFNPTPDGQLRDFAPDRPPKADSAYTVDAGRFQYETDLVNYSQTNFGGVTTKLYQAFDPVWKFGLTNWMDFELQYGGYQNLAATDDATGAVVARSSGFGDVFVKSKINVFGNDGGSAALALIPYVKIPGNTPSSAMALSRAG